MIILIMGLPGSGKTTLAKRLHESLPNSNWLNADEIRTIYDDWDFSEEGRLRQATRMKLLSLMSSNFQHTIIDMVCPLPAMRETLNPDIVIWMDTIKSSRYEDTNSAFIKPNKYNYHITSFDDIDSIIINI